MSYHCSTSPKNYSKGLKTWPILSRAASAIGFALTRTLTPLLGCDIRTRPIVHVVAPDRAAGAPYPRRWAEPEVTNTMNKNKTRLTAIVGTTMALVIAGTAAVSAAGPRDDRGPGKAGTRQGRHRIPARARGADDARRTRHGRYAWPRG